LLIFVANKLLLETCLLVATRLLATGEIMLHRDTPRYKGIFSETFLSQKGKHHEQQYRSSKDLSGLRKVFHRKDNRNQILQPQVRCEELQETQTGRQDSGSRPYRCTTNRVQPRAAEAQRLPKH
jgi:hypothetical protein